VRPADIDGDFVVFVIDIRLDPVWKLHDALPVFLVPRMRQELSNRHETGLPGHWTRWGARNVEGFTTGVRLRIYMCTPAVYGQGAEHLPAWTDFNRRIGDRGSVGIGYATYRVESGLYEAVYRNLPSYKRAEASSVVPSIGRHRTVARRLSGRRGRRLPVDATGNVNGGASEPSSAGDAA